MGNIFSDIVEDIEVKPNKSKTVLKWVVRIAAILIAGAFTYGQFRNARVVRLGNIETAISELQLTTQNDFDGLETKVDEINVRIDKIYDDGNEAFLDYQDYNRRQLELVIDYGSENKDMLKRMLELNSRENAMKIEADLERSKSGSGSSIEVTKLEKDYYGVMNIIEKKTNDTTYYITGATMKYITSIDTNKYVVSNPVSSINYTGRYDVNYKNK